MKSCKNMFVVLLAVAFVGIAARASAGLLDSSTFPWKYEMTVDPTTQDLDGNGTPDMAALTVSGGTMSYSGGILTMDGSVGYEGFNNPSNGGTSSAIWQAKGGTIASGFELESRLRIVSDSHDNSIGPIYFQVTQSGPVGQITDGALLNISASGQGWGQGTGSGAPYVAIGTGTEDNSTDFHTWRIVAAQGGGNGAYSVYRDGLLLAGGLNSGSLGDPDSNPMWQIGRLAGGSSHGVVQVDYIRFTPTGPAVPEPGTLVLLGTGLVGLLAYAWRRRK